LFFKRCEILSEKFKGYENYPENIKGSENFPFSEKNKGCETIRGAKFSSARENIGYDNFLVPESNKEYEIFQCQRK